MFIEFGLLYLFCVLAELKENNNSERRKDEEDDFCDSWGNFTFSNKSLCLR